MGERGGYRAGGGRQKGSKNKFPSRQKMLDELLNRGFDFFNEYIELYRKAEKEETREKLLMRFAEFLFPKLRPVDLDGKPEESSKEAVLELVKQFSEMMNESK